MRTLPTWLAAIILTAFIITLLCLSIYLAAIAINSVLATKARLEKRRSHSEAEALDSWKALYEDEKKARRADTAALMEEIGELTEKNGDLLKQIENKNALLKKVKVAEL